jgi:chorismate dehydratase
MSGQGLRIGAVGYLNSKPLVEDLQALIPGSSLEFELPSHLADRMAEGEFDVGLIPVVEFLKNRFCTYLPGLAVGCRGPVLSVCVFSKVPFDQIRSISIDEGSRTSAALLRILFHGNYWSIGNVHPLPICQSAETVETDAVLIIGDRAMRQKLPGFPHRLDLGEEWFRQTGLPFVFAVWAVRPGLHLAHEVIEGFQAALNRGMQSLPRLAVREAALLGKDPDLCLHYLSHHIRYDLGATELAGLHLFQRRLDQLAIVPWRAIHEVHRLDSSCCR